jgi:hypothetical protein
MSAPYGLGVNNRQQATTGLGQEDLFPPLRLSAGSRLGHADLRLDPQQGVRRTVNGIHFETGAPPLMERSTV